MAKQKIQMSIRRQEGEVSIEVKIPKRLEKFFSKISEGETEQSNVWFLENDEGAKFYKLTDEYQNLEDKINQSIGTFNNYGDGLVQGDKINLATLRTKGASEGVELKSSSFSGMANVDFEYYVRALAEATKRLYQNVVAEKEIKATITIEI